MGIQHTSLGMKENVKNFERFRNAEPSEQAILGSYVELDGEQFFKVTNAHLMRPFFMSLVSSSDHWLFIASNGALTAGRKNSDLALFPYYSSDKIIDLVDATGPTTIIQFEESGQFLNWEPFSNRGHQFNISRNIYKNGSGSTVVLEEINHSQKLLFRYSWTTGDRFGFIRTCTLINLDDVSRDVRLLDGFQNLMPGGLATDFQLRFSNLGNAYKKNELLPDGKTGVYYLSSVPTDRAEPSEGLLAAAVSQIGLNKPTIMLSNQQMDSFRAGKDVTTQFETRGEAGCYLATESAALLPNSTKTWQFIADVNLDQTDVFNQQQLLAASDISTLITDDVEENRKALLKIVSSCDGVQKGSSQRRNNRHLANTTFNAMRGGVPLDGYLVCTNDLKSHISVHNQKTAAIHVDLLEHLPEQIQLKELLELVGETNDANLKRICHEYLPLWFSRRHGDPTRPWNEFNIEVRTKNGQKRLNYEGNWRDLFQNWEALGVSFPQFLPSMVLRFVNASTADGYNPYRVTKNGFDWEAPDPNDPWANFGYWCDHQIIYQLKLLEWAREFKTKSLDDALNSNCCVYANVPYRISDYATMLKTPRSTLTFDHESNDRIQERVKEMGSDGKLLFSQKSGESSEALVEVTLFEKLLLSGLTKLSNLIPEAGVWLNTQRPEWNDANNALVGNGASVVTTCYLRRYFAFLIEWISEQECTFEVSQEIHDFFSAIDSKLNAIDTATPFSDGSRREVVDAFQSAGSNYRQNIYNNGFSGTKSSISHKKFIEFAKRAVATLDQTIFANRREDNLFHAYNLVSFEQDSTSIENLNLMLEGQVAVLSSKALSSKDVLSLLDALVHSDIYREDQKSFMLYPNKKLASFLDKNLISSESVEGSTLLTSLIKANDHSVIRQDNSGDFHFAGELKNAEDLQNSLNALSHDGQYASLIEKESESVCEIFEAVFQHHKFTGRSETFFAYEGLGSIYWHMVSKLVLAVQECYLASTDPAESLRLKSHYETIRDGLGLEKSPEEYGAIPTDPYSHTPKHRGAQQPGMTGQVKEDFLTRLIELGIRIEQGCLRFDTSLFEASELLNSSASMEYTNVEGDLVSVELEEGQFGFTFCQVPMVYQEGADGLKIHFSNSETLSFGTLQLPERESQLLFGRKNDIVRIDVSTCFSDKS